MAGAKDAALVSAVVADDLARVLVALESGASARARRERDGWSVLHLAALSGSTTVAGLLIDGGADLDAVAVTRETVDRSVYEGSDALHAAANSGHVSSIRCLVALGVNVDARCDTDWTPLMSAAWQGHAEATQALLAAGADPTLTDSEGKTALAWARASQRRQAIPLLEAISET